MYAQNRIILSDAYESEHMHIQQQIIYACRIAEDERPNQRVDDSDNAMGKRKVLI